MDSMHFRRDEPDHLLGGSIALLLLQQPEWVHRRVESLSFLDAVTMRRQVSTDFEVPGKALIETESVPVVPLALLEKAVLVDFDLRDEGGQSVPLLTRSQNGYVAWSTLCAVASSELEEQAGKPDLPSEITQELKSIVKVDSDEAEKIVDEFRLNVGTRERSVLAKSDFFMSFVWDFSTSFLLLAPCEDSPGTRRILKYSYAQELEARAGKRRERFFGTMGWIATEFDFDVPALGSSESYHLEFVAPAGLPLAESMLTIRDGEGNQDVLPATVTRSRAHAYTSDQSPEIRSTFSVWLWPSRSGLLRASLIVASASLALFLALLWDDRVSRLSGDSAAALLLAIPGLIAAFIVRPGEHGLVTDLVRGIRGQVAVVGASAYAGALALVGSLSERMLLNTWRVLVALTLFCFLSIGIAFIGFSPRVPSQSDDQGEGETLG